MLPSTTLSIITGLIVITERSSGTVCMVFDKLGCFVKIKLG